MSLVERLFSLAGRAAVVGGASRGIGEAIAQGLSGAGAAVTGLGRSPSAAGDGSPFTYRSCDLADRAAFERVLGDVVAAHGRLDAYVHAAGITLGAKPGGDPYADFRRTIDTNLAMAFDCCRAAAECMAAGGGGSIVCVTSINAVQGFPGNPGYVASKAGLRMLVRALALDYGARLVRVNSLMPGYVRTAMTEASFQDPAMHAARQARMILPRWGTPDDLVGAAIFLVSDASAYVTGQDLVVDGGWTAKGL